MAAAASGIAALPWPNAERATSSFSKSAHSQIRIPHRPFPIQTLRRSDFNPRCEMGADKPVQTATSRSLRSSALELLKTSSADRYTKERSSVAVIGLNVHTAPVELREKLAIPEAQWSQAIGELCALNHIEEAAVLSTCNRMEIYVVALSQHRGVKEVTEWMSKVSGVPVSELSKHRILLYNEDATQHLFEVAAGLDSLVLGEGQILAQVKHVVTVGQGVPGFDRKISGLFKHAITVGKRVRTETNIASGSVSVSSAAVELALMKLPKPSYATARVVLTLFLKKQGLSHTVAAKTINKSDLFVEHLISRLHAVHKSRYLVGRELTTLKIREALIPYLESLLDEHGDFLVDLVESFPNAPVKEKPVAPVTKSQSSVDLKKLKAISREAFYRQM